MDLRRKAALITGGATGLGRAVALRFAAEGVNVAINYSRSAEDAEKTAGEIRELGVSALVLKADVSVPENAERLVRNAAEALGRLDILVNNAGTTKFVPFGNLDGLEEEDFLRLFRTNALPFFFTARAAGKIMKSRGGGHIINTVSSAGQRPGGSSIAYAVSKAAGIHFTKCLAVALAPEVKVNGVAPGILLTRWAAGFSEEQLAQSRKNALLGKITDVDDCAAMYVALAKNESITGQIITIDSGQVL